MKWIEAVTRPGDNAEIRRRVLAVVVNRHPRRLDMLDLEQALCSDDAHAAHHAWHALPDDLQIELNCNYHNLWASCSHFRIALGGAADPAPSWWPPEWGLKIYLPRHPGMSDFPNPDAERFADLHDRFMRYQIDAMPSPPSPLTGAVDRVHDATVFIAATTREHLRQMWRRAHDRRLTAAARRDDIVERARRGWEAAQGFAGQAPLATATAERDRMRATALAAAATPPADVRGAELRDDLRALPVRNRPLAAQRIVDAARAGIPEAVEAAKAVFSFNPLLPPFSEFPKWRDRHQAELAAALAPREWAKVTHADLVLELHGRILRAAQRALEAGAADLGVPLALPPVVLPGLVAGITALAPAPSADAILDTEAGSVETKAQAAPVEPEDEPAVPAVA